MRVSILALAAAGLFASAAVAQPAPQAPAPRPPAPKAPAPKPIPVPPVMVVPAPPALKPLPEKWEDLPAATQERMAKEVKPLSFQSVLKIQPSEMSGEARFVEAGAFIALQKVSPARGVRLTSAPRRKPYGEVGSILWQARDAEGDLWCRLSDFNFMSGSNYYCYRDKDADGVFDQLFEGGNVLFAPGFQTLYLGQDERMGKPVSYAPADPPDMPEVVALRYHGVQGGMITDDGKVVNGTVEVELIVGKDPKNPRVLRTYEIELDVLGKGWTLLPTGHAVEIDKVEVGGRARIKVDGGLAPGEGYLLPERNKDRLLMILRRQLEYRRANPPPPRIIARPPVIPPPARRPPDAVPPAARTPTP